MNIKTKVLILTNELTVGGAEKLIHSLAHSFDRKRFEPRVVALRGSEGRTDDMIPEFKKSSIPVSVVGMKHWLDFPALFKLAEILRKEQPDVLHTHLFVSDVYGRFFGKICGVPVIVSTLHMVEKIRHLEPFKSLDRWTSRLCEQLIAVSENVKNGIHALERIPLERIQVIANAIEHQTFEPGFGALKRKELQIPQDAFVIGMVSRLEGPRKGHRILLEALRPLITKIPNLCCLIIGDGPDRAALEGLTAEYQLNNHVRFLGNRHDVEACLQTFDVFTLPSFLEGMPIVLLEAMAAKLPVLATPVGGVPEMIENGKSGLLIPPGDAKILAESLETLYKEPALRERLAAAALDFFMENYDMEKAVQKTEVLYEKCLARVRNPKIKTLFVASAFDTGGVTTYLQNLISHAPQNFEISLAAGPSELRKDLVQKLGIPFYEVPIQKALNPLGDLHALWHLYRFMHKTKWDIVHTHNCKADFIAGLAARLAGVPLVVSSAHGALVMDAENSFKQRFFDALEKIAYRLIHHKVIGVSEATTQVLLAKKKVLPKSIVTLANGIEIPPPAPASARNEIRTALGLAESNQVVISVCRFKYPKAPQFLIQSIANASKTYSQLRCLIVGDGPDKAALQAQIQKLGLEKQILLLGERQDVPALLQASDIFVLSTLSEGTSMSLLEGMAAGLPCIASAVGGNVGLIETGKTGLLVPPSDAPSLTHALTTLLSDASRRAQIGKAGKEKIEKQFSISEQSGKTYRYLKGWLEQSLTPSYWKRIQEYYREDGFQKTVIKIVKKMISPVYLQERLCFLEITKPLPSTIKSRLAFTIRLANSEDLNHMSGLIFNNREKIEKMIADPNERCFLVEYQNKIIAMQWALLGGSSFLELEPFGYRVRLAPNEMHFHDSRALREFRGQGVMNDLQMTIYEKFYKEGYTHIYTDVEESNETSLTLLEKVGMNKFEFVNLKRILGFSVISCKRLRSQSSPIQAVVIDKNPKHSSAEWIHHIEIFKNKLTLRIKDTSFFPYAFDLLKLLVILLHDRPELMHWEGIDTPTLFLATLLGVPHKTVRPLTADKLVSAASSKALPKRIKRYLLSKVETFFYTEDQFQLVSSGERIQDKRNIHLYSPSLEVFNRQVSRADARAKLRIPAGKRVIGTLTSLNSEGKPWDFINYCEKVAALYPDTYFVLAGDGPLFLSLKFYIETHPLAGQFRVLRHCERRTLLKALDIFVPLQSSPETKLALLEARAFSTTILENTDIPSLSFSKTDSQDSTKSTSQFEASHLAHQFSAQWHSLFSKDLVFTSSQHWTKNGYCKNFPK